MNTEDIKSIFKKVVSDVIEIAQSRWNIDWQSQYPKMGIHYYYEEIQQCESFQEAKHKLLQSPIIQSKYSDHDIESPIMSFVKISLASISDSNMLDRSINHWWPLFCNFILGDTVDVRLLIGLSNFNAGKSEYLLDSETKVRWFGTKTLDHEIEKLVPLWHELSYPENVSLWRCNGVIQVDFRLPATKTVLESHEYRRNCIDRLVLLSDVIQLAGFGYVGIGPWTTILNPMMPMDSIVVVGESGGALNSLNMPMLTIDENVWGRICNIYEILKHINSEDEKHIETNKAVRRRFHSVISRFIKSYEKGLWESTIVDLVILMESILTPNKKGGRMPLALAASNLLGTTESESREVYENINRLYGIRNGFVHGEPITKEQWEDELYEIARAINRQWNKGDSGIQEFAVEIARDYARRCIVSILNLYYYEKRSPSTDLTNDLQKMHLDMNLKKSIQQGARCYSFSNRSVSSRKNN